MNPEETLIKQTRDWSDGMKAAGEGYGRYKMCESSCHDFSLDGSSLAADLLYMLNVETSDEQKDRQAAFFNSLQHRETGFYHEPFVHELENTGIDRVVEMSGTYLGFQVCGALKAIERKPQYPFRFYEFTLKQGAITKYIEEKFPWYRSPWGAGGWIDSVATMLKMNIEMGLEDYRLPIDEITAWLIKNQNPENGLWGDPNSPQGLTGLVNGSYHLLRGTLFQSGLELPWPEKVIDSCIEMYRTNEYFKPGCGEGCHDLDLFDLLTHACTYKNNYRKDEIEVICTERLEQILTFQNRDGAFSFYPHIPQNKHNYYQVSNTSITGQSDMQGTVFYLHTIKRISEYLDMDFNIKRSSTHGYKTHAESLSLQKANNND